MPFHDPDGRHGLLGGTPMQDHFLTRAKAYAALIGSVLTVIGTTLPDNPDVQKWIGLALALCTAVATFTVPNKPKA